MRWVVSCQVSCKAMSFFNRESTAKGNVIAYHDEHHRLGCGTGVGQAHIGADCDDDEAESSGKENGLSAHLQPMRETRSRRAISFFILLGSAFLGKRSIR